MKHVGSYLLILLFSISFAACKKTADVQNDWIDPGRQPSELCKALKIEGANQKGGLPDSNSLTNPKIVKNLLSASVTNDNRLFLTIATQSVSSLKGVYLSVEGADSYWDIPLPSGNSTTKVLSVGIPARVLKGGFRLIYRLYDVNGKVGNKSSTEVKITDPVNYCNANGATIGLEEGNDGIDVKTFTLGDQPGWVTIEYNMFTVKDRMDIQYGKKFIRSTGSLLVNSNDKPPIGKCSDVGLAGDGFISGTGKFQFYYEPSVSRTIDIYMSGCLDGGTAWEYKIVECPKDLPTLGIHSNWEEGKGFTWGHAWVSLTENGQTILYGLWPDSHPTIIQLNQNNGAQTDIRKNVEKGLANNARYYQLNSTQLQTIKGILLENKTWAYTYNCSSFAEELLNRSGVDNRSFDDLVNGASIETPRSMMRIIRNLEAQSPTTSFKPLGMNIDFGSCSMCN